MTLWFILTLLTIMAVALLAWPFWNGGRGSSGTSSDVYRAQLSEIEREEAAGIVSADDARMARIEVQRRLIASAEEEGQATSNSSATQAEKIAFFGTSALVAFGSLSIYLLVGQPNLDTPQMRSQSEQDRPANAAGSVAEDPLSAEAINDIISTLETQLADKPANVEGWRILGWTKFQKGDYAGASDAYARALELKPDMPLILSAYGEALIMAQGGIVDNRARSALRKAVSFDPGDVRARFLLGIAKQQDGDAAGAIEDWLALLENGSVDDPWYWDVRARIIALSESAQIDITDRLPPAPRMRGPTQEQIDAAAAMSPEEQQAMIESMVSRLAGRLRQNPDDIEGWIRLIGAYKVLGREDKARSALSEAQTIFADNPDALSRLPDLTQ